jgi:hypothetical protein
MTITNAFTTAWKDLKAGAAKVDSFLNQNSATIQGAIAEGSAVAVAAGVPAAAVTSFDSLEEVVMAKVAAAAQDTANTSSLTALLGDALPAVQSVSTLLKTHPTVATVTAALKS